MYKKLRTVIVITLFFANAFIQSIQSSGQISNPQSVGIIELIYSITDSLKKHYIFPEKADSISVYLISQLKKNAYKHLLGNPLKLAQQIEIDIHSVHHDPHMRVHFDPNYEPQKVPSPTPEEIKNAEKFRINITLVL